MSVQVCSTTGALVLTRPAAVEVSSAGVNGTGPDSIYHVEIEIAEGGPLPRKTYFGVQAPDLDSLRAVILSLHDGLAKVEAAAKAAAEVGVGAGA